MVKEREVSESSSYKLRARKRHSEQQMNLKLL